MVRIDGKLDGAKATVILKVHKIAMYCEKMWKHQRIKIFSYGPVHQPLKW